MMFQTASARHVAGTEKMARKSQSLRGWESHIYVGYQRVWKFDGACLIS